MTPDHIIFVFIVLGLVSGILGGLFGIGGGVVTVPALYYIFEYSGMLETRMMQVAVSTSLAAGFVTSLISTYAQQKKRAISFEVVKLLLPGLALGCIVGSIVAHYMRSNLLEMIFGIMAMILGVYFCFPKLPHLRIGEKPNRGLSVFGVGIGVLSSMLGIGGGSLTFPVLLGYQVAPKNASATSSASTLITTLIGTVAYLVIAWHQPELPETFGYIEMRAFLAISFGSMMTAPVGVKLSHSLPVEQMKQSFGGLLALTGLSMLVF
jgi:hypothetical protein